MRQSNVNVTIKQHYKMYKAGKVWLFAAISSFAIGAGAFSAASMSDFNTTKVAADTNQSSTSVTTSQGNSSASQLSASENASQSTSTSVSESESASQSTSTSVSQSQSASTSLSQSQSISASLSVSQSTAATSNQSTGLLNRISADGQTQSSLSQGQSAANLGDQQEDVSATATQTAQPNQVEAKSETADRTAFNSQVTSNGTTNPSKTSITIAKSDQLTNMDAYRQQAEQNGTYAAVSDWNSFSNAYSNNNITFIDIQQNISAGVTALSSYSALKERNNSLILNGNGYTLALGRNALRTGKSPNFASNGQGGSVLTVTNLNLQQWTTDNSSPTSGSQGQEGGNNGQPDAAIDAYAAENSYGGWIYNIDNVSLQGQSTSSYRLQPARLLDAEGSYVVLSGNINVSARYSMMRISKVDIVNGANINFHVVGTPNLNDTTDFVAPMFDFSTNATTYSQRANATGNDHLFRVGDGVSISGTSINYVSHNALVQGTYYGMYVGDNVTWTQDFYDDFINQKNYNSITHPDSNRQYIFVQNFTFKALNNVDTHGQATYGMGYGIDGNAVISTKDNTNAYIYFAPGLTFSIN